jgi:hypothetical protein
MKPTNIKSILLAPVIILAFTLGCSDDDAITYSASDANDRITGLSASQIGGGQPVTVTGKGLDKLIRIMVGNQAVPARLFTEVSSTSLTFPVPTSTPLGVNEVLYVFEGSGRATGEIEIVPLQIANSFTPYAAGPGETVTISGLLLDLVDEVKLGGVSATITSQTATSIRFTVPAGVTTGPITLISPFGTTTTSALTNPNLTACEGTTGNIDCTPGVNLNFGFESGAGDNFDNWNKFNGGALMVATTTPGEVFGGSRAMKVTRDGTLASGQWRIQLASDLTVMEVGASYTVHIWARASVTGGALRVSTAPTSLYTGDQVVPTTWTRLAFTFTANETPARIVLDMNGNNTVATTFFIDDVKLIKN